MNFRTAHNVLRRRRAFQTGISSVLFKDTFSNAAAAPLAATASADTRGVWVTVDVENLMSVSSGKLQVPAQVSAVWGEEYRRAQPDASTQYWTRPTGKALVAVCTVNNAGSGSIMPIGWYVNATPAPDANQRGAGYLSGGSLRALQSGANVSDSQSYTNGVDYPVISVWTSWGVLVYAKLNGIWHLKWVNPVVFTQGYCGVSSASANATIDDFKIVAVDESVFAPALDITSPTVGNLPDLPDSDFLMYLDNITRPSAGDSLLRFKKLGAGNFWRSQLTSASGSFNIAEVVGGSATTRITGTGVVNTDDEVIITRAQNIAAWRNTTALGSAYSSAYNFLREVGLELESLGTGGAIGSLKAWKARLLDESGLGSELIFNGDFTSSLTGWSNIGTPTVSEVTGGRYHFRDDAGAVDDGLQSQATAFVAGTYYKVTFDYEVVSGILQFSITNPSYTSPNLTGTGTATFYFVGVASANIRFREAGYSEFYIDNVSVKAITFTADSLATILDGVLAS